MSQNTVVIQVQFKPKDLIERFAKGGATLENALIPGVDDLANQIERRAKRAAPVNTGYLRSSINTVAPIGMKTVREVGSRIAYAPHVEFGTKPHFPPVDAIYDWVWKNRGKFGVKGSRSKSTKDEMRVVAYLIARAISKRGTKARPYLMPAFEEVKGKVRPTIQFYIDQALKRIEGEG